MTCKGQILRNKFYIMKSGYNFQYLMVIMKVKKLKIANKKIYFYLH